MTIIYPSPLAEEISYEQIKYGLKIHNPYGVPEVAHNRCCDEAIKCIEKLEKIQEIVSNSKDTDGDIKYNWLYEQISEVLEHGTVD